MKTCTLLLLTLLLACGPEVDSVAQVTTPPQPEPELAVSDLRLPSEDQPNTVDVGSWNIEWFGAPTFGPTDEALQQANVKKVLQQVDLDLVGLVEVVSEEAFHTLLAGLPNHDGLLVTDPRVQDGAAYYSPNEQKVALLFKRRFTVDSARVVATEAAYDFGGRPPMEVKLSFQENGAPRQLVVLVAHFKALANFDGYSRRTRAAAALKTYLDGTSPSRWVLVVGDLNDDLERSTYQGKPSPFLPWLADGNYRFTTAALSAARISTTATFSSTIDHHFASASLGKRFVEGSARVLHPTLPSYATTTTDHFPVLTRYDLR
jgi:endonuclease/exonuclease/phosphatase family metal-dependent hydrolase